MIRFILSLIFQSSGIAYRGRKNKIAFVILLLIVYSTLEHGCVLNCTSSTFLRTVMTPTFKRF